MKNDIRLLLESFFDDDLFNSNDINQDIQDIGDQYYNYQIGDIYYENNKPYAICCGDKSQFKDKTPRFCLYTYKVKCRWVNKSTPEFDYNKYENKPFVFKEKIQYIDENGYENTQIVKKKYWCYLCDAFKLCYLLGDKHYLPAIDELQILALNLYTNKLNIPLNIYDYNWWSSTQSIKNTAFILTSMLNRRPFSTEEYYNYIVRPIPKDQYSYANSYMAVRPFLYIK